MGLLDAFLKGTGDPERDAAINQGLLNAGLALMQARGRLFPALGQAGTVGLQAANQYTQQRQAQKRAGLQDQMLQYQLGEQQRQAELAQLPNRFLLPGDGGIQPQDATGGMETAVENPNNVARSTDVKFDMQGYIQALMAKSPMQGLQLQAALQKDNTPLTVKEGETLLNRNTLKPIFTNAKPEKPQTTGDYANWQAEVAAGRTKDDFTTWTRANKRAGASNIGIDLKQPTAFATGQGKEFSDMMGGINKQSFTAPAQLRKLERMTQLLEGVDGGKLAPVGLEVASAANAMGIKMDPKLGNKEAAQALAREIAGGFRQPGTGPMTDKDFENFLLQVPDLSKSAEGRKQITATMSAALNRDIALGKLAREYVKRNGQLDNGFLDEAAAFIAENPVVGAPAGWKVQR